MSRHKDFDQFFTERRQTVEPVTFRLGEEDYTLPGRLPAEIGLLAVRLAGNDGADTDLDASGVGRMLETLLGAEQYARLMKADIDISELMDLFAWIMEQYQDGVHAAEEAGPNPKAPATPGLKPESSKTGA